MASANSNDKLIIFKGDDTGGTLGRRLAFTIEAGEGVDLSGCHAEWIFDGIVKSFAAPLIPGEVREVFYSHNETRCMALGVRYGTFRIIDAAGKVRTLTNTKPVEVTNDAARCYPGASDASFVVHGIGDMKHSEFADLEEKEEMTLKEVGGMVNTLIRKLKGTISAFAALLAFGAFADGAITPQTDFGDISPTAKLKAVVEASGAISGIDTNAVDILANSAVVTNALTVATTNRVAALESSKADKDALTAHVANTNNPHAVTAEQIGAVPLVEDKERNKTAVTIGRRKDGEFVGEYSFANGGNVTASGNLSHAEGDSTTASGVCSHAEGVTTTASGDNSHSEGNDTTASGPDSHSEGNDTTASGPGSHAEGISTTASGIGSHAAGIISKTREEDKYAFAWNGDDTRISTRIPYPSHGPGTFNINPVGGLDGFWIGEQTLYAILTNKADKADISSTNPTFSNAVLAVNVDFATNTTGAAYVAVTNALAGFGFDAEALAELPGGKVYGSIGALLAALAAAAAWLKKNKVGSFASVGGASATVENGVAKLSDFFTESNSLLTVTIDARLPYPLNAVTDETGLLKDRAINTTSLASVTVPDNFTDLLIRATVASSLSVTMPAGTTKYGDTFPSEAGEYLITITKTGAAEAYVRTIKLEEVA